MKKINWGIIGCGDVTEVKSGPAFNKVDNSSLVAVMRRDASKAEDYARRHNVPRWYSNADELIRDPGVNAIYIATPPSSHEEYSVKAINAGKPVYLEKPMAVTYDAARSIADAARKKNIKLVVAHYRREQPRFKKVKQLLIEGCIGQVILVNLKLYRPALTNKDLEDPRNAWRVDPVIAGGGLFHDLAPHQLDLMFYYFGNAEKIAGMATNQGNIYNADDLVAGNILFKGNVVFNGVWCFNTPSEVATDLCEIIGSKGTISFSVFGGNTVTVHTASNTTTYSFDDLKHVQQPMIDATVKYFLDESPNPCTAFEGAEVMRIMEAIVMK